MVGTDPGSFVVQFRHPTAEDARAIHQLVVESGELDLNSQYAYLLLCDHFSGTCLVAEGEDGVVGFVTGYVLPGQADTLFIWQVCVSRAMRGRGVAGRLLDGLINAPACRDCVYVEATVTVDNKASRGLFESLASRHGARVSESAGYGSSLFGPVFHAREPLLRVGPMRS